MQITNYSRFQKDLLALKADAARRHGLHSPFVALVKPVAELEGIERDESQDPQRRETARELLLAIGNLPPGDSPYFESVLRFGSAVTAFTVSPSLKTKGPAIRKETRAAKDEALMNILIPEIERQMIAGSPKSGINRKTLIGKCAKQIKQEWSRRGWGVVPSDKTLYPKIAEWLEHYPETFGNKNSNS